MDKALTFALAIAVSLGTTAFLTNNRRAAQPLQNADAQWPTDGAFRDGLYLGRLSARTGLPMSPPVGRWSMEKDRNSFLAGYRRGYSGLVAAVKPGSQLAAE